jgi:hypothetical protein
MCNSSSRRAFLALGALILPLLSNSHTQAQTLSALDQGWYRSDGLHVATNSNYITGIFAGGQEYRSFFVFDLSGLGSITSADLQLFQPANGGYSSVDASETFLITRTSVPASVLNPSVSTSGLAGQQIFNQFGRDDLYGSFGSIVATAGSQGTTLNISLNSAGLAYLNSNLGQQVAITGRVSTLSGSADQSVFRFSTGNRVSLSVTQGPSNLTPEVPGSVQMGAVLLALGAGALYKRRRQAA